MKQVRPVSDVTQRLAVLADAARLRLLRLLEQEELSVGEIARVVQLPQSTTSRQLKLLADQGWLARRNVGPATYYRLVLDDLPLPARALWLAVRDQLHNWPVLRSDAQRLAAVLAERRLDSEAFFGRLAGEWDAVRTELFGRGFTACALLSLIDPTWVVADLGCGTGNASEYLAELCAQVIAIDRSEGMLAAARKRLAGARNIRFVRGELEALPLPDRSVDATVCVLVLHHLDRPIVALREMARVLRADRGGGVALIVEMVAHDREEFRRRMGHKHLGFTPRTMEGMLRRAGLRDVRWRALPCDPEATGPGLFVSAARVADAAGRTGTDAG